MYLFPVRCEDIAALELVLHEVGRHVLSGPAARGARTAGQWTERNAGPALQSKEVQLGDDVQVG